MCTKSYLILVNNPKQPLHAINSFKKEIFTDVEEGLYIKKLTLIFLLNPKLSKKGPGTSDQLLIRLSNNFKKNSF